MITLVSGYSKSGKTTLCSLFANQLPWNYAVYSKGEELKVRPMHRVEISRAVRDQFIPYCDPEFYEEHKDKVYFLGKTFREFLDPLVAQQRKKDPYFFIKKCYERSICGNEAYNIMITDHRFPQERDFLLKKGLLVKTIRVYREGVQPKKLDIFLDEEPSDFLLVPLNDHQLVFPNMLTKFPQYQDYQLTSPRFFD